MSNDTNDHIELSENLLNEVFLRCSVETLLHAKCSCKQWFSLIQNSSFKSNHFNYQKDHNKGRLFVQYHSDEQRRYVLFDDETLERDTYQDIDHLHKPEGHLFLEGPINGLYCLFNGENRIVLWNPTLMELKTLPLPHPHFFPDRKFYQCYIGFGIDESTCDYKLVLMRKHPNELHEKNSYVTIFNLTTNTWRLHNSCNFSLKEYISVCRTSSFLDGSCHWLGNSGMVIAFNMAKEMFRLLMGPDVSYFEPICSSLTLYNEKITLMVRYENFVDVWMMLEDGVWIKQFSVTSLPWFMSLLGLWKNNGLLIDTDLYETNETKLICQIVLCDSNTQERRFMGPKGGFFQASVYNESLVSVRTEHTGKRASLNTVSAFLKG